MANETWWDWVNRHLAKNDWTQADLSRNSGVDLSVIHRWRTQGAQPSTKNAAAVAHAFGRPVVEAAIIANHYTAEDLRVPEGDLGGFTNEQIASEVLARMNRSAAEVGGQNS